MIRVLGGLANGKRKLIISYMRLIFYKNLYAFYVVSLVFSPISHKHTSALAFTLHTTTKNERYID